MRTFFWIPLAVAGFASNAPAQPAAEARGDAAISELLSYSVSAADWHEHLTKRKQAGWVPPPLPTFVAAESADIEKLADYWRTDRHWGLDVGKPSASVRERLVVYCEKRPGLFETLAGHFSASQEGMVARIQKLHDHLSAAQAEEARAALPSVRRWLMTEGGLFRDELKAAAERYFSTPGDPHLQAAFEGLQKHDPEAAKELLLQQAMAGPPEARCTALLRLHALKGGGVEADRWREGLQQIATTSDAPALVRARALKALHQTEWPDKAEWVLTLFKDATLGSVQVSTYSQEEPLALLVKSAPDFWVPKVIPLVGSADRAEHNNAVRCLVQFHLQEKREDALRPLLPWLSNTQWALDDDELLGRLRLLQTLDSVNLPESVPGLLWALERESGYGLRAAASALAHYQAVHAVPALRKAIAREADIHHRRFMVSSLIELKGMPLEEQAQAVEQQAALTLAKEKLEALEKEEMNPFGSQESAIAPGDRLLVTAGLVLSADEALQTPELAEALVKRVDELRQKGQTALAEALEEQISFWKTPASMRLLAARLKAGRISARWLRAVFFTEGLPAEELKALRDLPPTTAAIVALLIKDEARMWQILDNDDAEAQAMLLACGRLRRAALPLDKVARLLDSKHILCARGAELYLEAEDSPQARALLQRRFQGEARILGARMDFDPGHHAYGDLGKIQDLLRQRVLSARQPLEIMAMLSAGYWGDRGQTWIEIQGGTASLINDQGGERVRTRELTAAELAEVRAYMDQHKVDELPPLTLSVHDGVQYEYVHLTAEGGRRVFMNNPGSYSRQSRAADDPKLPEEENDSVYVCLVKLFEKLVEDQSRLAVAYRIADEVKGLRIVIPREKDRIGAVMRQGGVLMVNKSVPGVEEHIGRWAAVTENGTYLPETKAAGPALKMTNGGFPDGFMVMEHLLNSPWRTAAGGGHVRPANRQKDDLAGLWLCRENQPPELIVKGTFANPLTSLDGQWVLAARADGNNWGPPNDVVRIHLASRKVTPLKLDPADTFDAVAMLPHSGEILVSRARDKDAPGIEPDAGPEKKQYHLVNPATGALRRVTGEFRPLEDESWRPLQATGEPGVVWAAVARRDKEDRWNTSIGRYDLRSFAFTKLIEIPRLYFTSMDMWVDAEAGQIFLVVNGDLLAIPLPEAVKQ